jgi:DNA-directed RNA polymerase subunit RPC12/RpoP
MAYHERNEFRARGEAKRRIEVTDTYQQLPGGDPDYVQRKPARNDVYVHTCVDCSKRVKSSRMSLPTGWMNTKNGIVCDECSDGYEPLEIKTEILT